MLENIMAISRRKCLGGLILGAICIANGTVFLWLGGVMRFFASGGSIYIPALFGALLFYLIGFPLCFLMIKNIIFLNNKEAVKKSFEKIGKYEDIEKDCAQGYVTENNIYLGEKYAVYPNLDPGVMLIEDIIWIYGNTQSANFVQVFSFAVFADKNGKTVEVSAKAGAVPAIAHEFQKRNKRIIVGYSEKLDALYKNDICEFIKLGEKQLIADGTKKQNVTLGI